MKTLIKDILNTLTAEVSILRAVVTQGLDLRRHRRPYLSLPAHASASALGYPESTRRRHRRR